jgi:hypothetical protein
MSRTRTLAITALVISGAAVAFADGGQEPGAPKKDVDATAAADANYRLLYVATKLVEGQYRGTLMMAELIDGDARSRSLIPVADPRWRPIRYLTNARGLLYLVLEDRLIEVDLSSGEYGIVAEDLELFDYVRSGRLYCVQGKRLVVYDLRNRAVRDLMANPFHAILSSGRDIRVAVSPDEKHLAFAVPINMEERIKSAPLLGAVAVQSSLDEGYRHVLSQRLVIVDLETGEQLLMPTPFAPPNTWGFGTLFPPPPPLVWRNPREILIVRGDRSDGGRPSRGVAAIDVKTGNMWDVLAVPGGIQTGTSFTVRQHDGAVRLVLGHHEWGEREYIVDQDAARLFEENGLGSQVQVGYSAGTACLTQDGVTIPNPRGFRQMKASSDGKLIAWTLSPREQVEQGLWIYNAAEKTIHQVSDGLITGRLMWAAEASIASGDAPDPPAGWRRFTSQPWPAPKPRKKDTRPDVADHVALTLSTDKTQYTQHEQVQITVTMTNLTDKDLTFKRSHYHLTMSYGGGGVLHEFEQVDDVFPTDPVRLDAGQSIRCTRTVETYALGEHTVKGRLQGYISGYRRMPKAEPIVFVTRETADSDRVLKAKFERQLAHFRANPKGWGARYWGTELGPKIANDLIAEIKASDDPVFRDRMGMALMGTGSPDAMQFLEECLTVEMKTDSRTVLDFLLKLHEKGSIADKPLGLLLLAAEHASSKIRLGAVERLARIRDHRVEQVMAKAVRDPGRETSEKAARYLAACEGLDLTGWLAVTAAKLTEERFVAARAIIADVEAMWRFSEGKLPSRAWEEYLDDSHVQEQFQSAIRAWESWARRNPSYSARFFDPDRRFWPKEQEEHRGLSRSNG